MPRWIWIILTSPFGRRWIENRIASSAGQHNLSLSVLLSMPVPLPPLGEQREISLLLDEALIAANEHEHAIDLALKRSTAQRQNILKAAFSSQLVPQDPNDEPASVLLDRIRAERATQQAGAQGRRRKLTEAA